MRAKAPEPRPAATRIGRLMPRLPQLRTRVLAGVLLITLVALAAFDITAVKVFRGYLLSQTDSHLKSVLTLYRPLTYSARGPLPPGSGRAGDQHLAPDARPSTASTGTGWRQVSLGPPPRFGLVGPVTVSPAVIDQYWVSWVAPQGGRKVVFVRGNPTLIPKFPSKLPPVFKGRVVQTMTGMHQHAQLRVTAIPAFGGSLVAATDLSNVNSSVGQLTLTVVIGSVIAGFLVFGGVGLVLRRGLRPIEAMATQADRISAGDLTDRVSPHDSGSEVGRLGAALNGMLGRIEASLHERETSQELTRRFFADASHELRNPLASLRANAELYQQGALRRRSQVDEAMRRIALEAQRMSGLVDDMLRLARLDQHPEQRYDAVDLTALVYECAKRAEVADPERDWHTGIEAGLTTAGDEELLRRAIGNLLANVSAHTPDGTTATILATRDGSTVTVEVSDDGPGVAAEDLPRIFERFYRASRPALPGSGLGLAIVHAIASTHGGSAEAGLNDPHGLSIALRLPAGAEHRHRAEPDAASAHPSSEGLFV